MSGSQFIGVEQSIEIESDIVIEDNDSLKELILETKKILEQLMIISGEHNGAH